jgi:hypothetical protein
MHGFNPVLYSLSSSEIIKSLYEGALSIDELSRIDVTTEVSEVSEVLSNLDADSRIPDEIGSAVEELDRAAGNVVKLSDSVKNALRQLLSLVKTFTPGEFQSIYCEREWRSNKTFSFSHDDLAMIVLPRKVGGDDYYTRFNQVRRRYLKLPMSVPVVPWEDLIEH